MNFNISIDDRLFSEWLSNRIQEDVIEKYGIKIIITQMNESEEELKREPESTFSEELQNQDFKLVDRYNIPDVLSPPDIQKILGIGRRGTYELLKDPPFRVVRIGNKIKVSKESFLKWLDGG